MATILAAAGDGEGGGRGVSPVVYTLIGIAIGGVLGGFIKRRRNAKRDASGQPPPR